MAEYIRFRWTRTKAGVTMAFLALLGGLVDRAANAEAAHGHAAAAPTSSSFFPKLTLNGLSGSVKTQFVKLDKDLQNSFAKYDKAILTLNSEVIGLKANTFDKIYSKHQANATFLSKQDAAKVYMKDGSEAANSAQLGGLGPSAFLHGDGGVATGGVTAALNGNLLPLVTAPDRSVSVQAELTGNGAFVVIANHTTNAMTWIATIGGRISNGAISGNGGQATLALADPASQIGQATVQLIPAVQNGPISTLTVSTEPSSSGGQMFVGQLLNGAG